MKTLFLLATLASVPLAPTLIEGQCRDRCAPTSSSSSAATTSPLTTSFIDAGAIRVGGKAADFWLLDDFCLGTSTANTCSGGAELTWSPNSVYLGNVTSGEGMQISGTSVAINKGGGVFGGTQRKLVVAQNANPQLLQHGHGAMTAGSLAVSFSDTYSVAPDCTCTHTSTTNLNSCAIDTANPATTTAVTFTVTLGGTDRVDWTCVGDR